MGRDTPAGPAVASRVELRLAGAFGVIRDGAVLSDGELGSRKSRTLLKLLAVERPGLVPVQRIIEVLWAGHPPAAAERNIASLVSRLRGVLGSGVILGGRPGYRLADSPEVNVDLDLAAQYCEHAERKLAAAGPRARAAARPAGSAIRMAMTRSAPVLSAPVYAADPDHLGQAGGGSGPRRRVPRAG